MVDFTGRRTPIDVDFPSFGGRRFNYVCKELWIATSQIP